MQRSQITKKNLYVCHIAMVSQVIFLKKYYVEIVLRQKCWHFNERQSQVMYVRAHSWTLQLILVKIKLAARLDLFGVCCGTNQLYRAWN